LDNGGRNSQSRSQTVGDASPPCSPMTEATDRPRVDDRQWDSMGAGLLSPTAVELALLMDDTVQPDRAATTEIPSERFSVSVSCDTTPLISGSRHAVTRHMPEGQRV
jgi:hypothetical protein